MARLLPYGRQHVDQDDIDAVVGVLHSEYLTQGPIIDLFEQEICRVTRAEYCVAVANGTAALHLSVAALEVPEGSSGITSPNTFVSSANCLAYNGITPLFADIDERTYNIDVGEIRKKLGKDTRIIIPVHFAGQPAEMQAIHGLAKDHGVAIVEDAAHAIGSRYHDGTPVGSCRYADLTVFSFHPVKTITTGEGGAITTNSRVLYDRLRMLRTHGITKEPGRMMAAPGPWYYEMQSLGFNYRLTDIQSALGLSQLKKLQRFVDRRREIVSRYNDAFGRLQLVVTPYETPGVVSAFHLYVLRVDFDGLGRSRAEIIRLLGERGVGTQVHYIPVHTQPYYRARFGYDWGECPVAENYYRQTLSLPLFPAMDDDDVDMVIASVREVLSGS